MKIYVSGPMSGYPELNRPAFDLAAQALSKLGHEPVNPHSVKLPAGASQGDYIRADLKLMLDCDGVATIGDWRASWGACIEVDLAHRIPMPVRPLDVWLMGSTS